MYVLEIDSSTNSVIVGVKDETYCRGLIAKDINWVALNNPKDAFEAKAKIRSASSPVDVVVYPSDSEIKVEFKDKISSIAPAQAVVLYDEDVVLGGGTIKSSY